MEFIISVANNIALELVLWLATIRYEYYYARNTV